MEKREREREKERKKERKKEARQTNTKGMKQVVSKSIQTMPLADFWDRIISFMGFWYKMECWGLQNGSARCFKWR